MNITGKVLIIDDDAASVAGLQALLELEGHEVITQPSPIGLTFQLKRSDPDVILLDMSMPGLDGDTLLRLGRKRIVSTNATVILYSGRGREELAALSEELGADGFFSKGEHVEDLLLRMTPWIAARRARDRAAKQGATTPVQPAARGDLQPVIILRTNETSSRSCSLLQLAGYVVVKADSNELTKTLADSCGASVIVAELSSLEAVRYVQSDPQRIPTLLLTSGVTTVQRRAPGFVTVMAPPTSEGELLTHVDKLAALRGVVADSSLVVSHAQ